MKKIILTSVAVAGVLLMTAPAHAVDSTGCGLGSIIFKGQKGPLMQILAVTTNGSFGTQTFGNKQSYVFDSVTSDNFAQFVEALNNVEYEVIVANGVSYTLAQDETLTIPEGKTLVFNDAELVVEGTITNNGYIIKHVGSIFHKFIYLRKFCRLSTRI